MRIRLIELVGSVAFVAAVAGSGCSSPSTLGTGSGGSPGTGSGGSTPTGTGGTSGGSCPGLTPCGGSVNGSWTVSSSCLNVSGDMDVTLASLGCKSVPVNGSLHVTGSWTAKDGTYTDNTVTTGTMTFPLAANCLSVSSVNVPCDKAAGSLQALGWASVTCSVGGGGQCTCSATANQKGGIGVISPWASDSGNYTTDGSGLNVDMNVDYNFCASGSMLTLAPKPTILPITGTIVLQKGSATGTGGSTGTGGVLGTGGAATGGG
ncbi:MAG TPA: hypothetical protein VHO67_11045, partial [Polyangia bacterium]|nr:hypothetical protein [Polyangia bacterium]